MAVASKVQQPKYVHEFSDNFLRLWPNRFDYIFSPHPNPGEKPDWQTETRHPLSDRLIGQGAYLYGVRPGTNTSYVMLDIDRGSPYHPAADRLAIERICEALEPLGLVQHLTLTSSKSGGLHLYFPFSEALPSWKVGITVSALLENSGFKLIGGWLETFPNRKPFVPKGEGEQISLFNAHRLPLQYGSYLLNEKLEIVESSQSAFVRRWQHVANRNDIDSTTLTKIVKVACRKNYYVSGKAEKFLNDLNACIEPGWSGAGQTNDLLGRIAMRSYIFGHVLDAVEPLEGQALIDDIVEKAQNLPGYQAHCNHQSDIHSRAKDWAQCVEQSKYFHYGNDTIKGGGRAASDEPSWNDKQCASARDRIKEAVLTLFRGNLWPEGITERFNALCAAGIGGSTLYKNRDLWHPRHIPAEEGIFEAQGLPVENPPDPPFFLEDAAIDCAVGASLTALPPSLLGAPGSNPNNNNTFSSRESTLSLPSDPPGSKKEPEFAPMDQQQGLDYIKEILRKLKESPGSGGSAQES